MRVDKKCRRDKGRGGRCGRAHAHLEKTQSVSAAFRVHRGDGLANNKEQNLSLGSCLPAPGECARVETVVHLLQQAGEKSFAVLSLCLLSEDVRLCVLCYKSSATSLSAMSPGPAVLLWLPPTLEHHSCRY